MLAARETIGGRLHRTPTLGSASLERRLGIAVALKAELFQRTGSFKVRGVLNKLARLTPEQKAAGVIAISAGNHAQAVAFCSAPEGIDALVVMWAAASAQKIAATRGYGASVDLEAQTAAEAFERLAELIAESGRTLIHPFDDPDVIAGQGTVGLELAEDAPGLELVLVPVGGGGLVSGIAAAVECPVIAVEPERSAALTQGLAAGHSVPVEAASVADGCNAPFAGEQALAICRERGVRSLLVTEDEIAEAMRFLYTRAKLACEPAGAVALAGLLAGKVPLEGVSRLGVVVSGGNVAGETAAAILAGR